MPKKFTNVENRTLNLGKAGGKILYFKPHESKVVSDEQIATHNSALTNAVLHNQLKAENVKVSEDNKGLTSVTTSEKKTVRKTRTRRTKKKSD